MSRRRENKKLARQRSINRKFEKLARGHHLRWWSYARFNNFFELPRPRIRSAIDVTDPCLTGPTCEDVQIYRMEGVDHG